VKKQTRSVKHPSRAGLAILVGAVAFVIGGYLLWANQPLPLEPNEHPLPQQNGFVVAMDAAGRLTPSANGAPLADRRFTDPQVLREKLAPSAPYLAEVRRSLGMEWGIPTVQDFSQTFPYLPAFREAARQFAAESRLALATGRPGDAEERALDAIELGTRLAGRASLIHHLTALSLSAIGTDQADRVAPKLSAAEAKRSGARLDRIIAAFPRAAAAFREERWVALNSLQRIFRDELDPIPANPETAGSTPRRRIPWFLYPKPWSYHSIDRGFRAHIAEAEKPYRQRQPVQLPREPLARLMLPVLDRALLTAEKNRASLRLLRLELALQEYHGRHGKYPETLTGLVPEILPVVPDDPYSGQSFRYQMGAGGYSLYSVGPDLKDDRGTPLLGDYTRPNSSGDLVAGLLGYRRKR
jgi:hypothetical protein